MSDARYSIPRTVDEALKLAASAGNDYLFVGGGTDIQVYRKQHLEQRRHLIDLTDINDLRRLSLHDGQLVIGSMTSLDQLARSTEVRAWSPLLTEAAQHVATPTIRCTATVGGNLLVSNRCTYYNQSKLWRESAGSCLRESGPTCLATGGGDKCYARNVSDMAPALIALNAQLDVTNAKGLTAILLSDLYIADGLRAQGGLSDGAIITSIRVTIKPVRWFYRKLRHRESIEFTSLTVAGAKLDTENVRICISGVSTAPVTFEYGPEETTLSELQSRARRACKTVDNDLMPLKYRRHMIDLYLEQLWQEFSA